MITLQMTVLAFSLSADAFAASMAKGARYSALPIDRSLVIALGFGLLEGLAPLVGYLLGQSFAGVIAELDHWVAFGLLGALGLRMVWASLRTEAVATASRAPALAAIAVTAVGTSVDAMAVGVTLALVSDSVWLTIGTIAVVTFVMTFIGLRLGRVAGARVGRIAELAGGLGLLAIGSTILYSHLTT
jgi:putative Mn2+ efflux pump MntP